MNTKKKEGKNLENKISDMLRKLGIPCNLAGYKYLSSAILLCITDMSLLDSITGQLYPAIAKKYNSTYNGVKMAVCHAIEIGWQKADKDIIYSIFGHTISDENKKPADSLFIATIVEELRPKDELESKVSNMLRGLGIPCNLCGFKYLSNAILLCIKDMSLLDSITKELYPAIAKKYNTPWKSINSAIRSTLEFGWKKSDKDILYSIFGHTISDKNKKPADSLFIATIAEELRPKNELESKISNILRDFCVPCNLCGFSYLSDAILLCIKDISLLKYQNKCLYYTIAKKHNTSVASIDRGIRHAIEVSRKKVDKEIILSIFGDTISDESKKSSNLTFISIIVEKLNVDIS